jgi:hypothetical protein
MSISADALLAFQYCNRDEDGQPTEDAMVGAYLWAELIHVARAFLQAYSKK